MATIGQRIKAAREKAGITQSALGKRLGVSPSFIAQYETDKRKPKINTLARIASALDIGLGDLLDIPPSKESKATVVFSTIPPSEFSEFKQFLETMGYHLKRDEENYRICKGESSALITPNQLKSLVLTSKTFASTLIQGFIGMTQNVPRATIETDMAQGFIEAFQQPPQAPSPSDSETTPEDE